MGILNESPIPALVSSEGFSMDPWIQSYPSSAEQLRDCLKDAQIIVFLRDPVDWILSMHGLAVQKRRFVTLKEFVGWNGKEFVSRDVGDRKRQINVTGLSYSGLLEIWNKSFPQKNVHVFFYENLRRRPKVELERLCGVLGVSFPAGFDVHQRRNSSSTPERCDAAGAAYRYLTGIDRLTKPWRISHKVGPYIAENIASGRIPFPYFYLRGQREEIRRALESFFMDEKRRVASMYTECPW